MDFIQLDTPLYYQQPTDASANACVRYGLHDPGTPYMSTMYNSVHYFRQDELTLGEQYFSDGGFGTIVLTCCYKHGTPEACLVATGVLHWGPLAVYPCFPSRKTQPSSFGTDVSPGSFDGSYGKRMKLRSQH